MPQITCDICGKEYHVDFPTATNMLWDNKTGMSMCCKLLSKDLRPKEREFICSILAQLIHHPRKFEPTQRQRTWFKDIWHRNVKPEPESDDDD